MIKKLTLTLFLALCVLPQLALAMAESYLKLLPPQLGPVIIKYLSSASTAEEAIKNIKAFLAVDPRLEGLLTNTEFVNSLLNEIPSRLQQPEKDWASIEGAVTLDNSVALAWLEGFLSAHPDAQEVLKRYLLSIIKTIKLDEPSRIHKLQFLAQAGANLDHELFEEASIGDPKGILTLIQAGANVNATTKEGETPLIVAINKGRKDIVRTLIDAHANVNYQRIAGETPLMYAVKRGDKEIVDELIQAKADVNAKTDREVTILMFAASKGNKDIVKALLDAGVNIHAKDDKDRTALDIAQTAGHQDIVDLLKKH